MEPTVSIADALSTLSLIGLYTALFKQFFFVMVTLLFRGYGSTRVEIWPAFSGRIQALRLAKCRAYFEHGILILDLCFHLL